MHQAYTMADLSLEFLMGRALDNAMLNVGLKEAARGKQGPATPESLSLSKD